MSGHGARGGTASRASNGGGTAEYAINTVKMFIPDDQVGLVLGKGGSAVKKLQNRTGCRVRIPATGHRACPPTRLVVLTGVGECPLKAKRIIEEMIADKHDGGHEGRRGRGGGSAPPLQAPTAEIAPAPKPRPRGSTGFGDSPHNKGSVIHRLIKMGKMADVPATLHEVAAKTSDEDTNEVLAARLAMATKLANYPDWMGVTPLMMVAATKRDGNLAVCKVLLVFGTDVGAIDKQGNTALHVAAWSTDARMVTLLGAHMTYDQISAPNAQGLSALDMAGHWPTLFAVAFALHSPGPAAGIGYH